MPCPGLMPCSRDLDLIFVEGVCIPPWKGQLANAGTLVTLSDVPKGTSLPAASADGTPVNERKQLDIIL